VQWQGPAEEVSCFGTQCTAGRTSARLAAMHQEECSTKVAAHAPTCTSQQPRSIGTQCTQHYASATWQNTYLTSEWQPAVLAIQLAHDACLGILTLAHHLACLVALLAHISHGGQGLASDGVLGGLGVGRRVEGRDSSRALGK
jgi:hypothetical protein